MESFCNYLQYFAFGIYPYIVITTFLVGSAIRYDREQYSWKADSSQLLYNTRSFVIGSHLFHWGIILLFFGHFFGLLTPEYIYTYIISPSHKQLLAMIAGGIFGIICFIGLVILIYRRLFIANIRNTSRPTDIIVLLLLFFQLCLGLMSIYFSSFHLNGTNMILLATWAQHIITFRGGAADLIININWIFKLHIVTGLTIFLIFPFTRLVHIFSVPIPYLWRTGYQVVRSRRAR